MSAPTKPSLLDEIRTLEARSQDPTVRRDRAAVAALLREDFVEFGSSGRRFDLSATVGMLAEEGDAGPRFEMDEFEVLQIADDAVLATYRVCATSAESQRHSWRSSLWLRTDGRWRMRFHQGTLTQPR